MLEANENLSGEISKVETLTGEISGIETLSGEISNIETLSGQIDNEETLSGAIYGEQSLDVSMHVAAIEFDPTVPKHVKNITEEDIERWNKEHDYDDAVNKPQINGVELIENKTLEELGIQQTGDYPHQSLSNTDIEELLNNFA